MSLPIRDSAPFGLVFALLLATSAGSADAAVGPPAHIGLTPGSAIVYVGEDQIYTATLYDTTYQEAAIEVGSHIGFAIDMPSFATVTIDAGDPHLGHVVGTGVGTTYVRAFYLRNDGTPTNITTMANLEVVPADGTGGTPGTGGVVGTGGAPGTGGTVATAGASGTGGTVATGGAGGGLAACANTLCGAACVNLAADPANCGTCGRACPDADTCANGTCVPPQTCAGVTCSGICADTLADPHNCGACGKACLSYETCTAGACAAAACLASETRCGATCNDLRFDMANCGHCGATCPEYDHECVDGRCVSNGKDGGCAGCSLSTGGSGATLGSMLALGTFAGLAMVLRRRRRR
jgi:hypothetical protein